MNNFRHAELLKVRLSTCDFAGLNYPYLYHLSDFIQVLATVPEFHCILALDSAIELANSIFQLCEKQPNLREIITYDTTFEVGQFFLSTLVMKNIYLEEEPIFPVIYYMHNRKTTETHETFFRWAFDRLNIGPSVPIVTDRELAIVNSIRQYAVGQDRLFFCTNHILQNTRHWLLTNNYKNEMNKYQCQMRLLNLEKSTESFNARVKSFRLEWDEKFTQYFNKHIQPAFLNNFEKLEKRKFEYFQDQHAKAIHQNHFIILFNNMSVIRGSVCELTNWQLIFLSTKTQFVTNLTVRSKEKAENFILKSNLSILCLRSNFNTLTLKRLTFSVKQKKTFHFIIRKK